MTCEIRFFAKGQPVSNEPRNASLISIIIAFLFIAIGSIEFVVDTDFSVFELFPVHENLCDLRFPVLNGEGRINNGGVLAAQ